MPFLLRLNESISLAGRSANSRVQIEGEGIAAKEVVLPPAKAGQLTTRNSDSQGTLTMASGHGITTGARLDVYWINGSRRGMIVGTVSSNTVPLTSSGAGDALPDNLSQITACVPQEEDLAVEGDDVVAVELFADRRGTIVLADATDAEISASVDGLGLDEERSQLWFDARNPTNPLAGESVAKVFFSNGDAARSATLRAQCLYN